MFPSKNLLTLCKGFYQWLDRIELLKVKKEGLYEYSDVYPLLYLKYRVEGISPFHQVKHLIIDEMQYYSPLQYHLIHLLFPCKKTILGDINQSINPISSSNLDTIKKIIPNTESKTMLKS